MILLENQTGSDIEIADLGITIPASGEYDATAKGKGRIAPSDDLLVVIADETVKLVEETDPSYTYYSVVDALRILADVPQTFKKSATGEMEVNMPGQLSELGDNKLWVHESSQPVVPGKQLFTIWSGAMDDTTGGNIGDGDPTIITTAVSTATSTIRVNFIHDQGLVYIHEIYAMWANAGLGDHFSVYVMADPSPLQQSTNLDLEIVSNKISPASGGAGTGTHGWNGSPVLVTNNTGTGDWDYDGSTLAGNTGAGAFDAHDIEMTVQRYLNKVPVYGTSNGYTRFTSFDTSRLPPGYFANLVVNNVSDTIWSLFTFMVIYRENTLT